MIHRGFTLIELLLVISILLLITGLSLPFYSQFLTQNNLNLTATQIANQIRKAQTYTIAGRRQSNWGVYYYGSTMTLFSGNSYATRTSSFDENWSINPNFSITGFGEIVFTRPLGIGSTNLSIILQFQGKQRMVTVNQHGAVDL